MRATLSFVMLALFTVQAVGASSAGEDLHARAAALQDGETLRTNGITMTMHRRIAGAKQADGWFDTRSSGCAFTVRLPTQASDYSIDAPTVDGPLLHLHIVAMATMEGDKFTATCSRRDDDRIPPTWAEATIAKLAEGQRLVSKSPVTFGGLAGYDADIESASGSH